MHDLLAGRQAPADMHEYMKEGQSLQHSYLSPEDLLLLKDLDLDPAQFLRPFHGGMARSTNDYNALLDRYLEVLAGIDKEDAAADAPLMAQARRADCATRLKKAHQAIKAIKFHCHNVVARDVDKIVDIKAASRGDGGKGPDNSVDLIQGCQIFCRVSLKGRKQPLKLYI